MAKKKRYRGHFCKVCGNILPNEKFSGKGHAAHICKKCTRKSKAQQSEEITITRIHRYFHTTISRETTERCWRNIPEVQTSGFARKHWLCSPLLRDILHPVGLNVQKRTSRMKK